MSGAEFTPHIPTPLEAYLGLPYQCPLFESYPVVRIPVAGPEPFNTLVVVRAAFFLTMGRWADGKLNHWSSVVPTNFTLIGFDPRVANPFEHSSTAAIHMVQTSDDSAFVTAADRVDGLFDEQGRWMFTVDWADSWDQVYAGARGYASAWVLCWEPPPPERPWDHLHLQRKPSEHWSLLEQTDVAGGKGLTGVGQPVAKRHAKTSSRSETSRH